VHIPTVKDHTPRINVSNQVNHIFNVMHGPVAKATSACWM
jgi:hypothetical protein